MSPQSSKIVIIMIKCSWTLSKECKVHKSLKGKQKWKTQTKVVNIYFFQMIDDVLMNLRT